jgi:dolichol-phosphate mannosyltransferase
MTLPAPLPDVTVLVLAWNERENIRRLIPELFDELRALGVRHEVLVMDAGSTDGTVEAALDQGATVHRQSAPGYGSALREGFALARGGAVVTMDGDLSHPAELIAELWRGRTHGDVVIGSRFVPGAAFQTTRVRRLLSRILNTLHRWTLRIPVRDFSSGYRLYDARAVRGMVFDGVHFEALEEILVRIYMDGWRLWEVPLRYRPRGEGRSKARLIRFGIRLMGALPKLWNLRRTGRTTRPGDALVYNGANTTAGPHAPPTSASRDTP